MTLNEALERQFNQPAEDHKKLVSAIGSASSYTHSAGDLAKLTLIVDELGMLEAYLQSSEYLTDKDKLVMRTLRLRINALVFDADVQASGWFIHTLRKGQLKDKALKKRWIALPSTCRDELLKLIDGQLVKMQMLANKIRNTSEDEIQREIGKQIAFLEKIPMLKPYVLQDKLQRPWKLAMDELEMLRTNFRTLITVAPLRGKSEKRPKQSTNFQRGTIYLIDKLDDYLRRTKLWYRCSDYARAASSLREELRSTVAEKVGPYELHKTSTSDMKARDYIEKLVERKAKLLELCDKELVDEFFIELKRLDSGITSLIEASEVKGRSGQEPGKITRGLIVFDLRHWWIDTTGDTSRVTYSSFSGGTYSGPFYEFVAGELNLVGLMVDGSNLQPVIKQVCDVADPQYFYLHEED